MNTNAISAFEYISILISIILGLGITQILSAIADIIYNIKNIKNYLPHSIWVAIILYLFIQDWFIIYELKNYTAWKLPTFLFILLYPITLYILSKLLFPPNLIEGKINLKDFFLKSVTKIYTLFSVCILLSILFNIFILKSNFFYQLYLLIPLAIFIYLAFKKIEVEWLHTLIAIIFLLIIITTTVVEVNEWYIK